MNTAHPLPRWLSAARALKVRPPIGFVAAFDLSFDVAARHFSAQISTDREGRGVRRRRYFFLQLASGRVAQVTDERAGRGSSLYLHMTRDGEVEWADLEEVLQALLIPVQEVFLQGGVDWQHRPALGT